LERLVTERLQVPYLEMIGESVSWVLLDSGSEDCSSEEQEERVQQDESDGIEGGEKKAVVVGSGKLTRRISEEVAVRVRKAE